MDSFSALTHDEVLDILYSTHPADYITLITSPNIKLVLDEFRYKLLKHWCVTDMSVTQLQNYLPNITLRQMALIANYWYPYKDMDLYNRSQLFRNAIKAGYTVDECINILNLQGTPIAIHDLITSWANGRQDITNRFTGMYGALTSLGSLSTYDAILVALNNPDVSIEQFVMIFRHLNQERLRSVIEGINILTHSTNPTIMRALQALNIEHKDEEIVNINTYNIPGGVDKLFPEAIKTERIAYYMKMSQYNSVKYPSYDMFDDIASGNFIEVVHKANTWNRDIVVTNSIPPKGTLEEIYLNIRNSTIGQAVYHIHPRDIVDYLRFHNCTVTNSVIYGILHHWCFPGVSIEQITADISADVARNYYRRIVEYTNPTGDIRTVDISIILLTALKQGKDDSVIGNIIALTSGWMPNEVLTNFIMICVKYNILDRLPEFKDPKSEEYLLSKMYSLSDPINPTLKDSTIYQVLNNSLLTIEDKINFLDGLSTIPDGIVNGLVGLEYDYDDDTLMGIILNSQADEEILQRLMTTFGLTLVKKYTQQDLEELIADIVENFYEALFNVSFPLCLAYYSTDYLHNVKDKQLQIALSYIDQYPITSQDAAANRLDWYSALKYTNKEDNNYVSKFGYRIKW